MIKNVIWDSPIEELLSGKMKQRRFNKLFIEILSPEEMYVALRWARKHANKDQDECIVKLICRSTFCKSITFLGYRITIEKPISLTSRIMSIEDKKKNWLNDDVIDAAESFQDLIKRFYHPEKIK